MRRPLEVLAFVAVLVAAPCGVSCRGHEDASGSSSDSGAAGSAASARARDAGPPLGAPRAGMAWIPPGTFRAGTPADRTPRIAEEELPGVSLTMRGFYIDLFPYPNEPGAIPTTNLARAEAERLCKSVGKRL